MAVIASATGVALGMTAGTIGAGLVGGAVLGAGIGGLYSAFTGDGDILNSMLTGGLIGFGVGGLGAAAGAAAAGGGAGGAAAGGVGAGGAVANSLALTPTATALAGNTAALIPASTAGGFGLSAAAPAVTSGLGATGAAAAGTGLTTGQIMGYGLAGSAAMSLLGNSRGSKISPTTGTDPSYIRPYNYAANPTNNFQAAPGGTAMPYNGLGSSAERRYFNPTQTAQPIYQAAEGGLTPNLDFMGSSAYPMSQQNNPFYAVPSQMPTSAKQVAASYDQNTNPLTGQPIAMAEGGNVNSMTSDQAVKAYNDAIMQKAIQTYATPQQNPLGQNTTFPAQSMAPPGYVAPQVPSNFDQILLDQYRSANPNLRSYNAATQMYGAGIPNQSQYDAFKAQKDKEAADLLAQQSSYSYGGDYGGGGGAAGGLPRDFAYANGGHLGGYSDGGRMLKGPGDGMSDNIPASINGKQPARLADGEFVVPADVVSHLGNGSTDAGAKRLYSMMDDVRKARTGHKKQGKQIKANKYLPA
jgi:hypothetical protein